VAQDRRDGDAVTAPPEPEPLLTPRQVAALYGVDPKSVIRWAHEGRFPPGAVVKTPGGHHKFKERAVLAMRDGRQP